MKAPSSSISAFVRLGALALVSCSPLYAAVNDWQSNSGDWFSGTWSLGSVPTTVDSTRFGNISGSTDSAITVTLRDNEAAYLTYAAIGVGKSVTFSLGSGASLNGSSGTWQVGSNFGTGTTPSHLTFSGDGANRATVVLGSGGMNIGATPKKGENSVTITGNVDVSTTNTTVVGRNGDGNRMTVASGAKFTGSGIWVGATQDVNNGIGNDNGLLVTGAGSEVLLNTGTNLALLLGARPLAGTGTSVRQSGNYVRVEDGAKLHIDARTAGTTSDVKIGDNAFRNNNFVEVTGVGSQFLLEGKTQMFIGGTSAESYGNSFTVANGAIAKSDGIITINHTRTSAGAKNRLVIGDGGTLTAASTITNNGGLVQLAQGGALRGESVAGSATPVSLIIQNGGNSVGRFEAAGSGLASNVTTTVKSGAVFAIGLTGATTATTLDLHSTVNMESGSLFEVALFGASEVTSVNLDASSQINLGTGVIFSLTLKGYAPEAGNYWSIFTGETSNVLGSFDLSLAHLPTLAGDLEWDYSLLNSAGGWQIGVIPEPGSVALFVGAGALLAFSLRRGKGARPAV